MGLPVGRGVPDPAQLETGRSPRPLAELRLLQAATALACLVPIAAGLAGILAGPAMIAGVEPPYPADLDSHYRYLSGLLLGVGLGFAACIPGLARQGRLFRALGLIVVVGGLARLWSLADAGAPTAPHLAALLLELGLVPALMLWQARVARLLAGEDRR